jgi:hypothetical protein
VQRLMEAIPSKLVVGQDSRVETKECLMTVEARISRVDCVIVVVDFEGSLMW